MYADRQLSGGVQRRYQLPADAFLRQQVPPDVERRNPLPEVVVASRRNVDDDGRRTRSKQIHRGPARDHLLTTRDDRQHCVL